MLRRLLFRYAKPKNATNNIHSQHRFKRCASDDEVTVFSRRTTIVETHLHFRFQRQQTGEVTFSFFADSAGSVRSSSRLLSPGCRAQVSSFLAGGRGGPGVRRCRASLASPSPPGSAHSQSQCLLTTRDERPLRSSRRADRRSPTESCGPGTQTGTARGKPGTPGPVPRCR